jgi:hypothetical protein
MMRARAKRISKRRSVYSQLWTLLDLTILSNALTDGWPYSLRLAALGGVACWKQSGPNSGAGSSFLGAYAAITPDSEPRTNDIAYNYWP